MNKFEQYSMASATRQRLIAIDQQQDLPRNHRAKLLADIIYLGETVKQLAAGRRSHADKLRAVVAYWLS